MSNLTFSEQLKKKISVALKTEYLSPEHVLLLTYILWHTDNEEELSIFIQLFYPLLPDSIRSDFSPLHLDSQNPNEEQIQEIIQTIK